MTTKVACREKSLEEQLSDVIDQHGEFVFDDVSARLRAMPQGDDEQDLNGDDADGLTPEECDMMQDIADRREQVQTDLGNNVPGEPDECEQAASAVHHADIANVVSMWKSWRDRGIRCLEMAHAARQLEVGANKELTLMASSDNVVLVCWVDVHTRMGRAANLDENLGVKAVMNTIPSKSYREPEWQVVHPAIGTRMKKVRDCGHTWGPAMAKRRKYIIGSDADDNVPNFRPRISDDVAWLQQMWLVEIARDRAQRGHHDAKTKTIGVCYVCNAHDNEDSYDFATTCPMYAALPSGLRRTY